MRRFPRLSSHLLLAVSAVLLSPVWAAPPPSADVTFSVPVTINGTVYQGVGTVAEDGSIRVVITLVYRVGPPIPGPGPIVIPVPVDKASFVYVIHDSKKDDPAFARINNDKAWRDAAKTAGIEWKVLDDADPLFKTMPNPLTTANGAGLPAAVFVYKNGASKGEPLGGKTPADMLALIKKYGGAK